MRQVSSTCCPAPREQGRTEAMQSQDEGCNMKWEGQRSPRREGSIEAGFESGQSHWHPGDIATSRPSETLRDGAFPLQ